MVNCGANKQLVSTYGLRQNFQGKTYTKFKNCYPSNLDRTEDNTI